MQQCLFEKVIIFLELRHVAQRLPSRSVLLVLLKYTTNVNEKWRAEIHPTQ